MKMLFLKGKDYTNCIGDYVKDLEKAYYDAKVNADVYEEKYTTILRIFNMLLNDAKEL